MNGFIYIMYLYLLLINCRSSCSEQYVNVNIPRCEVDLPEEELEDLPPYPALAPGDDVIPADPRCVLIAGACVFRGTLYIVHVNYDNSYHS